MNKKINLKEKLFSSKEKEIIDVLKNISEKGYPEIVTDLINLYSSTQFETVKSRVFYILANLKNNNSVPFYMDGLRLQTNTELKNQLISACWQNGLDYSDYLNYFIDIISKENMFNSIEAFSVIESNFTNLEENKLTETRKYIKELKKTTNGDNLKILNEVESLIS